MRIQHAYDCLLQHVHILITCKYFDVVQTNGMFKNAWQSLPKPHTKTHTGTANKKTILLLWGMV